MSSKDKKTYCEDVVEKQLRSEWDSLMKENKRFQSYSSTLQNQVTTLSGQLQKACSGGFTPSRDAGKRKHPSQYTKHHTRGLKKRRKDKCSSSLAWLESEGYSATQIKVVNTITGKEETIDLNTDGLIGTGENIKESEIDTLNMMLFIKGTFNTSGGTYHEMCKDLPRHYKLKECISELNKIWNIKPTPNGTCGVQQFIKERLQFRLLSLIRH